MKSVKKYVTAKVVGERDMVGMTKLTKRKPIISQRAMFTAPNGVKNIHTIWSFRMLATTRTILSVRLLTSPICLTIYILSLCLVHPLFFN